ncbi:MAG TPA: TRAP transporter TatT component family protein [Moraxellaceae bacterium]|nr:TRAP transporter TatT component family protein [Moraxellaceae bacterium]
MTLHPDTAPARRAARLAGLLGLAILLGGCGGMATRFAGNLSAAMMDNDDPAVVESGSASYLLLLDALVRQDPESPAYRQAAASLNSAYAGAFVKDPARAAALTTKALNYASEGICLEHDELCGVRALPVDELKQRLAALDDAEDDVPGLYTLGATWAGWVQAHADDFNAVADLPRVEAVMQRVIALDEGYQSGAAHLYLGVIATAIPPALGGRPEVGRAHFEKAIALSQGHNLMAKVYFARNYARGVFDRELHDKLLNEVKAADPRWPGWTLSNTLAQQEADALLKSADEYF